MTYAEATAYIEKNKEYLPEEYLETILTCLITADDRLANAMVETKLIKPAQMKLVSIFLGVFGIDRFVIDDFIPGLIKLATLGFFGIGWIIDIFRIKKDTKYYNAERILSLCYPGKFNKPPFGRITAGSKKDLDKIKNLTKSFVNSECFRAKLSAL